MKRFKNILYFADNNQEQMLNRAFSLARSNRADLTLMDIISPTDITEDVVKLYGIDLDKLLCQKRLEALDKMVEPYQHQGVVIKTQVVTGEPFIRLIQAVQSEHYDLLMKMANPQEGLVDRIFGSSDMHILRKCPCPVWIDETTQSIPYKTVLAAVDPMDHNCHELNTLIMDLATSLALRESAQLHVIHAWSLLGESMLISPRGGLSKAELAEINATTEQKHVEKLEQLITPYGLTVTQDNVSLVKAEAARAISAKAIELNADIIVMGTLGRTGIPGLFIGNTAENVLNSTHTSVLAVKPQGFISPVTLS